jgi:hypothetical protein
MTSANFILAACIAATTCIADTASAGTFVGVSVSVPAHGLVVAAPAPVVVVSPVALPPSSTYAAPVIAISHVVYSTPWIQVAPPPPPVIRTVYVSTAPVVYVTPLPAVVLVGWRGWR